MDKSKKKTFLFSQSSIDESIMKFGLNMNKLLVQYAEQGENVIFSPIGIYASLAVTHLASNGQTKNEIGNIMGLPDDWETYVYTLNDYIVLVRTDQTDMSNQQSTLI